MRPLIGVLLTLLARPGSAEQVTFLLDRSGGPPPVRAAVGGEERPVAYAAEKSAVVGAGTGTVPASGSVDVPVQMEKREDVIEVKAVVAVRSQLRTEVTELAPDAPPTVRVTFPPDQVGVRYVVALLAGAAPPRGRRVATLGALAVPPESRLRVGVAIEPDWCAGHPVTDVAIDAVVGRRARPLLRRRLDPRVACGRWTDLELSLAPFDGKTVSFRFRARAARAADRTRRLHVLWADPAVVSPRREPSPPNVILVSLDTLAARHVGVYGYGHPTTPLFDAMIADGALFTDAISHYPSTAASHMSMLTGVLPVVHGVRRFGDRLADDISTVPELLRATGYTTAAFTEDGVLSPAMGFVRGFHAYRETQSMAARSRVPGQHPLEDLRGLSRQTFRHGLAWLAARPPEPFFLFLHTYEVHLPFLPTAPYLRAVRPGRGGDHAGDEAWKYDAEVRFLDRALAHLMTRLRDSGALDRTVLIVTADHGEAFGEHGSWYHEQMLYDEVMRVPLFMRGPGIPRATRVPGLVGLGDVAPTILEVAGIAPPAGMQGRSLLAALRGGRAERPLVAELRGTLVHNPKGEPDLRAVWIGGRKAILDVKSGRWEVYDWAEDPEERRDLAASAADTIDEARRVLAWYDALAPRRPASSAAPPATSPELRQRLRALGYVE